MWPFRNLPCGLSPHKVYRDKFGLTYATVQEYEEKCKQRQQHKIMTNLRAVTHGVVRAEFHPLFEQAAKSSTAREYMRDYLDTFED